MKWYAVAYRKGTNDVVMGHMDLGMVEENCSRKIAQQHVDEMNARSTCFHFELIECDDRVQTYFDLDL